VVFNFCRVSRVFPNFFRHPYYPDPKAKVHCSFENVFTQNIAQTVGTNIHKILGILYFRFICDRRDANLIRDKLLEITTDIYSHIWFSMQDDPFNGLYDPRSVKVTEYPVFCYFGSMYSYSTFKAHSDPHPDMQYLRITKWKGQLETVRIMSRDESKQMTIPVQWIQNQVLVRAKQRPVVVLMLKYSVILKMKKPDDDQSNYER
jgi:hypothetical protein